MQKKPRVHLVSATEAKNRFGEMIKRAYTNDEHLIVERGGIPVVAIVPMQDYERLVRSESLPADAAAEVAHSGQAAATRARLKAFLAEAHRQASDLPEAEVDDDIQAAVEAVRRGR